VQNAEFLRFANHWAFRAWACREQRMAVCNRRLFLRLIWAPKSTWTASAAVTEPPSALERILSTASNAPGIFRSVSIQRICSRREGLTAQPWLLAWDRSLSS
jgi:hypothetical protein